VISWVGKVTAVWWKVTAAYHRVYDSSPMLVIEYGTTFLK